MKNIILLATEKPTFLHKSLSTGNLITSISCIDDMKNAIGQNIYITSNKKPKAGDWSIYQNDKIHKCMEDIVGDSFKKIILTTDPVLISNGVQAISDEFLEWFVKNPSCEQVEVHELRFFNPDTNESEHCKWELYIPKEESKQETHICKYCGAETSQPDDECYAKPKQETLEEVAERYAEGKSSSSVFQEAHKKDFIEGAKWQQERMYSKSEQLINELESLVKDNNLNESYRAGITSSIWRIKEWFELKEPVLVFIDYLKEVIDKKITKPTDKYKYCNHHHELTDQHEIVNFGDGEFVANKKAILLLKALNELGLRTRSHHIADDSQYGWFTILLDNVEIAIVDVNEADADRTKYNGKKELRLTFKSE